jgi:hypothetical protein
VTISNNPLAFTYPAAIENRRHGPTGYSSHESYRPWLRDEFAFRCAYCLLREVWGKYTGEFDIDHFIPQNCDASLVSRYENLVYSCRACNTVKGTVLLPDAKHYFVAENIHVRLDGYLEGLTREVDGFIDMLALNSSRWVAWRLSWIRIVELAAKHDLKLFLRLMGFPDDLPDLSRLRPPDNSRPEGVAQSYFAQQKRGELPTYYIT